MRTRVLVLSLLLALLPAPWVRAESDKGVSARPPAPQREMTPEEKADAEIGKSAAEEVEKYYKKRHKKVKDSPDVPRIMAIIDRVRPVTEKPRQTYHVKIIEDQEINAFSLPGGYLYYTEGLLKAVESEDELAAITAHEMAHVCLNHARKLMARDQRYSNVLTPVIIASILARSESVDPMAIAVVGSLVVQDALNHYGREAELEADLAAIRYLHAGKQYNPVAVLTVVEGLAHIESGYPPLEQGIQQTHPFPKDRIAAVICELTALKIPIERRRVANLLVVTATPMTKDGREIGELRLNRHLLAQPATELGGASPAARAQRSAETLNEMLLADLQPLEISLLYKGDTATLSARGETILTITPDDAAFHNTTVQALAQQAVAAIRAGFQEEKLKRAY